MTGCRRFLPVLATAALVASAAPARAQSGAGDDQYTDPFGSSTTKKSQKSTTTTSSAARKSTPKSQTNGPPLSNQPPVQTSPNTSTTPTTPSPAPSATAELPRTGFEVPGIALLGAGLLASGIGLRMRTVDETLY